MEKKGLVMLVRYNTCYSYIRTVLCITLFVGVDFLYAMSANNRHDPFPVFRTADPHIFLNKREKLLLKGIAVDTTRDPRIALYISPFSQRANDGKDYCKDFVELGDINGRWSMVGLLLGGVPEGQEWSPSLLRAREILFPDEPANAAIDDPFAVDKNKECGFFSIPAKYRKYGIRFNFEVQILKDFGISLDVGISDIAQTSTHFNNLTVTNEYNLCSEDVCHCTNQNFTRKNINEYLMCPVDCILDEICYEACNFHDCSVEDIRLFGYWRHSYPLNTYRNEWPAFLLTPFIKVGGTLSTDKHYDPNKLFALSFGSKNHNSVGFDTGLTIDFYDTIEISAEAGITHFFGKHFCDFHLPTSKYQSGIFPFKTDVYIKPGDNWHFAADMYSYHFLGHLSAYFQYVIVIHKEDNICLDKPDPDKVFKPEYLECRTSFQQQVANIGFDYDISPHISIGFLWQAPLSQHNTFRATTIMFGFNAMF